MRRGKRSKYTRLACSPFWNCWKRAMQVMTAQVFDPGIPLMGLNNIQYNIYIILNNYHPPIHLLTTLLYHMRRWIKVSYNIGPFVIVETVMVVDVSVGAVSCFQVLDYNKWRGFGHISVDQKAGTMRAKKRRERDIQGEKHPQPWKPWSFLI